MSQKDNILEKPESWRYYLKDVTRIKKDSALNAKEITKLAEEYEDVFHRIVYPVANKIVRKVKKLKSVKGFLSKDIFHLLEENESDFIVREAIFVIKEKMGKGKYLRIKKLWKSKIFFPKFTKQETEVCKKRALELEEKITNGNLRLVIDVAKKYRGKGLDMADLVQEGNLGLKRAMCRFRKKKKSYFSTFAIHWIKQGIICALKNLPRPIRIPMHILDKYSKISKFQTVFFIKNKRFPTMLEIADATGLSAKEVAFCIEKMSGNKSVSLDEPIDEDEEATIADIISDGSAIHPLDAAIESEMKEFVEKLIKTLTPREQEIIKRRFGIGGISRETLEEIGNTSGVTRERIRQIEKKAKRILRIRGKKSEYFKNFFASP